MQMVVLCWFDSRDRRPRTGEKVTYQIVGDVEADIRANLISVSSPVARALIGKYEGDVVQVQAPSGIREFEIVSIQYL